MAFHIRWLLLSFLVPFSVPLFITYDGFIVGLLQRYYFESRVTTGLQLYEKDLLNYEWHRSMSLPDLPMEDMPKKPYGLPSLRTPTWWKWFNLTLCSASDPECQGQEDSPIDSIAQFSEFRRDPNVEGPSHHWIYIPRWMFLETLPNNIAFDELLRHHYLHPPAHNASIHLMDLRDAQFLGHIWGLKAPALVHISYKPHPQQSTAVSSEDKWMKDLYLDARYIELPMQNELPGLVNEFPSLLEQLKVLTTTEDIYLELEEWDEQQIQYKRSIEWLNDHKGLFFNNLDKQGDLSEMLQGYNENLQYLWFIASFSGHSVYATVSELKILVAYLFRHVHARYFSGPQVPKPGVPRSLCDSPKVRLMYSMVGIECVTGNFTLDSFTKPFFDFLKEGVFNWTKPEKEKKDTDIKNHY